MRTVYLIRHGLPDFPEGKRMCLGRTDLPLGQEGFRQAAEAAALLKDRPLSAVFSSPLRRAVQTASALNHPIILLEELQELCAGEWDGLTFDEIRERYPELYTIRATNKTVSPPGAEPNDVGLRRFQKGMEKAAELCEGDFAVVAHGAVIQLFLDAVCGHGWKPGYAEIVHLKLENGVFSLKEETNHA